MLLHFHYLNSPDLRYFNYSNPDVSHIALRHLAHALASDQGHIFAFTFYSPIFTEHLVDFFVKASKYLNWSSLDDILAPVFAEDRWGFSDFTKPDVMDRIWSRALEQALRWVSFRSGSGYTR